MRACTRTLVLLAASTLLATAANAGRISIAWDPVTDPDLTGYRIHWGTSPGVYTQWQDVGPVTTSVLYGLADCTTYYVAVKARDAAGNLSASYSNEIHGYPRPVVRAAVPTTLEQGVRLSVVLTGANFMDGATVQFANPGISANSVTVDSCTQITVAVTVANGAAPGPTSLEVTNPDHVFGGSSAVFTVLLAAPPAVLAVSPGNGSTGVPVDVRPSVTFSEPMNTSTLTSTTVSLLGADGNAVAQAAGSPNLSPDGTTAIIVPAGHLTYGKTYRIQVLGGASGAKDLANKAMISTFVQVPGFTTAPETTAPNVSAVSASAQATTAQITWTTDEPADSQVFYRKTTDSGYQQTALDSSLVTSHSVQLQGLAPSTEYSFYVQSADGAGNRTSSSPEGTFTTGASAYAYITIEAESGTLTPPVRATPGSGSFRGAWVDTPSGTPAGSSLAPSGAANLGFYVPADGTWYLWVRLYGASTSSDAWFESIDGAARQQIAPSETGVWKWTAGRSYTLTQGLHSLELGGRDARARADRVAITNDPAFVPTEQPGDDVVAPDAPANLAASVSEDSVTLGWTNPSSDVATIVVRVRTDGTYPTSPADGLPAGSKQATPSADDSFTHPGLVGGVTYWYSLFAVDASGNASDPAQIRATPGSDHPSVVLFSTSEDQFFAGSAQPRHQAVYSLVGSQLGPLASFPPPKLRPAARPLSDP